IEQMARTAIESIMKKISHPGSRFGRVLVHGHIVYRDSVQRMEQP
ncbi:transcriptional regulator, partial [Paenibacillus sp. NRS-1775]